MSNQAKQSSVTAAFRNSILARSQALGNSKRGLKEVASDLVNQVARNDKKGISQMCEGTFLSRGTIERIMECEEHYRPQSDTVERIFRYFNAEIHFSEVLIKSKYQNHAKE